MGNGGIGTSLGGLEFSLERKKRNAQKRRRQKERWAAKSGEVKVTRVDQEPPQEATEAYQS